MKLSKPIIVITLLIALAVLQFSVTNSQSTNNLNGSVTLCVQTEFYGDQIARSADFWNFLSDDGNAQSIYVVEHLTQQPVCSQILVDNVRSVVYHLEGDRVFYSSLRDFVYDAPCFRLLSNDESSGKTNTSYGRIEYEVVPVSDNVGVTIEYPVYLLLVPAYVGEFPLLDNTSQLMPYEQRGFFYEISTLDLELTHEINLQTGMFETKQMDQIIEFHLERLPGWKLADAIETNYPENPFILPGNRNVYFSLQNIDTGDLLRFELFLDARQNLLTIIVSVPPTSVERNGVNSIIEGSSVQAAEITSLFEGWSGTENGPTTRYGDSGIVAYTLQNDSNPNLYWFLDLRIIAESYDVIYSRNVIQTACVPESFLPVWATLP
ncbi:hypothetical protein [Aggregatilinea lenta]|uniref:hypothetical protein n=1 Tax=Aggregatilinea lenta TaxID=913108 RepID=UPI0013C3191F|nr:hypothetical protein [Aggregatilinea lenta]